MASHLFEVEDAKKYGVDKAIILSNLRFWLDKNKANKSNVFDGYYWTYNSAKAFSELFPYWSANKIQKTLKQMEMEGLIKSGCYNNSGYDRKKWYTTSDYLIQPNGSIDSADQLSRISQMAQPIADSKPDSKPDTKDLYVPSETKRSKFKFSDDDFKLAEWFFSRVEVLEPTAKKPNFESWANTLRIMREIDKRSLGEIGQLFDWANRDSFWCSNVLSPEKLRKQWGRLSIEKGKLNENVQQQNSKSTRRLTAEEELNQRLLEQYGDSGSRSEREINPAASVRMDEHQVSGSVREQVESERSTIDMEDWNKHSND